MKQIIILEKKTIQNYLEIRCLFWVPTPTAQIPFRVNSLAESGYKDITTAELQDLKDGKYVEISFTKTFDSGVTIAQIKTALITEYNKQVTLITNEKKFNYYGTYWDGTKWIQGGA